MNVIFSLGLLTYFWFGLRSICRPDGIRGRNYWHPDPQRNQRRVRRGRRGA